MNVVHFPEVINQQTENKRLELFSDESSLYFPTWELPAGAEGRKGWYKDDNAKYIARSDTQGNPILLGHVGKNYKVLPMKELCQQIERTIVEVMTDDQLRGVQRTDQSSYYGSMCIRNYIFPSITTDIESRTSHVAFRTIAVNGYDGSSSFKFYNGAIDFFCTNGMVSGIYDMMVKRHTAGLTIPKLDDKLRKSIDIFYTQAEQWKKWVGKEITDDDARECYEAMPRISERRVEQMMRQFHIECLTHGRTVWALYSAATYFATHNEGEFSIRETNNDHSAATLLHREQQVRSWLSTDTFERLAA